MYKLHLIRKYLLKRRIAWVALLAVTLCSALVMVVFSVMSGWLATFKGTFHGMTGDVVVEGRSLAGFPYYAEMIDGIRKVPGVAAAVPVIHSFGLINIGGRVQEPVQVYGYPADIGAVNDWPASLDRQPGRDGRGTSTRPGSPGFFDLRTDVPYEFYGPRPAPGRPAVDVRARPGIVVSGGLIGIRASDPIRAAETRDTLHTLPTTLTLLPVHGGQAVDQKEAEPKAFWAVDDSHSQVWQFDAKNVYVGFDVAQRMLQMDDGDAGEPARCSEVEVKAVKGFDLLAIRRGVDAVVGRVSAAHDLPDYYPIGVATWEEQQNAFITAVENEVLMTTSLFSLISLVAVLLIFCIFYMIVVEKTRDIGIIKSVGATGGGILTLFLGYGLAIGTVGAGLGVALAFLIVRNINEIHTWMGRQFGVRIWTPETYQFDRIPNVIEARTIAWTVVVALVAALFGALLPAFRAAGMNPVDSLRYE